jgi:T5SS/PEP-CTERM-associated repeat protein
LPQENCPFAFFYKLFVMFFLCFLLQESISVAEIIFSGDITPNDPETWTSSFKVYIGNTSEGSISVNGDSDLISGFSYIGYDDLGNGTVTVTGSGSTWSNIYLYVGQSGTGILNIMQNGSVCSTKGWIGNNYGSIGMVTLNGDDSTWTTLDDLYVGKYGSGLLTISNGALVRVGGTLSIDIDHDHNSSIHLLSGGKLAIKGKADNSISEFLGLIEGTDAICYFDSSTAQWINIVQATNKKNYTLTYFSGGELSGYTMLTFLGTPINGDANYDGMVDVGDLGILAANYGTTGDVCWAMGDFNLDGTIDVGDLGILAANYGNSSALPISVPEPMTLSLLAIASIIGAMYKPSIQLRSFKKTFCPNKTHMSQYL